ncbi:MAG TPA: sensor histidine kinase [Firmicutes bacterium]|nr:sensor histidine kinase [Bacillota bacterium]
MVPRLFVMLIQEMSVIAVLAFLMGRTVAFKNALNRQLTFKDKTVLVLFFGILSIVGTYTGIPVHGAIANTRAIGAISAGLLGGPLVGFLAGLIGGVHRYFIGGFTAFACGLSTTVEGLMGGLAYLSLKNEEVDGKVGFIWGLAGEITQMVIISIFAKPFSEALELIKIIMVPMVTVNAVGVGVFLAILQSTRADRERIEAIQAQKALKIAAKTLPYLRTGLNAESARRVAAIIKEVSGVAAVSLTDTERILAFVGAGADHHLAGEPLLTKGTKVALLEGSLRVLEGRDMIGCPNTDCPLSSGVVVPLIIGGEVVGTVKLYQDGKKRVTPVMVELGRGIGQLLATQLEIARWQARAALVTQAELKALQAQINPHFLFNALNTVVSFCRSDPAKARDLLIQLSEFFRRNLRQSDQLVTIEDEIEHVNSYLAIQLARYGERLKVEMNVDDEVKKALLPPLTLQPIVENSIKHGIGELPQGGTVRISAQMDGGGTIKVEVTDDGVGIPADRLACLLSGADIHSSCGTGIGLRNVRDRLKNVFGEACNFNILSEPGRGTTVTFRIPGRGGAFDRGANRR